MFYRIHLLSVIFLVLHCTSYQLPAMEQSAKDPVEYVTTCCNKFLTTPEYKIAKDISKKTHCECPYCDNKFFEVKKIELSALPKLPQQSAQLQNLIVPNGTSYEQITPPLDLYTLLLNQSKNEKIEQQPKSVKNQTIPSIECRICLEKTSDIALLSCNHNYYCTACVLDIVKNAVKEKTTNAMHCPECKKQLDEAELTIATKTNRPLLRDIKKLIDREILKKTPGAKECKTEGCEYIHIITNPVAQNIKCPSCKKLACSLCLFNHPLSMSCKQAELQRNNNKSEQQFQEWKKNNTKPCPTCASPIEKYKGGCSKVECSPCKTVFCYDCLEKTSWPAYHSCKKTTTSTATNNNNENDRDNDNDNNPFSRLRKALWLQQKLEELKELLQIREMLDQLTRPQATINRLATLSDNSSYFLVEFNKTVSEKYFNKFMHFMKMVGNKIDTNPSAYDFKFFKAQNQKIVFKTTMSAEEFAELIAIANDSEL